MDLTHFLSTPPLVLAFSFLIVLLTIFLFKDGWRKRKVKLPPSPPKLPVIGNLHQLGNQPHLSLRSLAQQYGPLIHLQLGHIPTVIISSARVAKEVLKTHDLAVSSRSQIFAAKHFFYNCTDLVFSPYGAYWRHIRKICILELLSTKRVESYSHARKEVVANLAHRVAKSYPGTTNLSKLLGLYANDTLCRVAFGRDFSGDGEYDQHGFQQMLEEFQKLLGGFSIGDFFPSMEFLHNFTGMKSRLQNICGRFDKLFDQILAEHLNPNRQKEEHKDLVDVLLDIQRTESADMPLTMDNIKAIILDMFAAGTDSTFFTLDWGMTELLVNPEVLKKAQAEVRAVVGERRVVLEGDLHQLDYMKHVVKEILRLHPAAALISRETIEDITVDGYDIPAKTRIFINAWAIGRDPESWEKPEKFAPERFIGSTIDFKGQDFEFLPFGAGRRGCPGITFSIASIELALAQLLHSFDWELPAGTAAEDIDMTEVYGISMHRIADLIVVARPRFL